MLWPDGAWVFSRYIGNEAIRSLAIVYLIMAAIGFLSGGIGNQFNQTWWWPVVITSAIFSSIIFILFWNGIALYLDSKVGVALLINLVIRVATLVLKWSPGQ